MSLASLEAFLEQAHNDLRLQELLVEAPDAAAVAAIAQAAGYRVSELDLWQASTANPAELLPVLDDPLPDEQSWPEAMAAEFPDPWLEQDTPISQFLHQAQGDEALQQALATAPDAATVATIAQAAGYPISELDLWRASAAIPEELIGRTAEAGDTMDGEGMAEGPTPDLDPWPAPNDEALLGFLHQAQGDEALQEALSLAPDAAAVAAIARAAGYPISELDLWRASGIPAEELFPPEPDLAPIEAPLARFLLEAEHDAALLEALATAEDAAAVAAIAQAAGYPITTADLWEASDALPEELLISELIVFEVEEELPN
jgi:predicted ribosomally synthesized peptide with nif11-like leader